MILPAYLIVKDRHGRWREGDGGDTADEVSNLLSVLEFGITRECPHNAVYEVPRNILLQLLELGREGGRYMRLYSTHRVI